MAKKKPNSKTRQHLAVVSAAMARHTKVEDTISDAMQETGLSRRRIQQLIAFVKDSDEQFAPTSTEIVERVDSERLPASPEEFYSATEDMLVLLRIRSLIYGQSEVAAVKAIQLRQDLRSLYVVDSGEREMPFRRVYSEQEGDFVEAGNRV